MEKPNFVKKEDLRHITYYILLYYRSYQGNECHLRIRECDFSHDDLFVIGDFYNEFENERMRVNEKYVYLTEEDAKYAIEYYVWEKQIDAQIAKESEFLQKLAWSKEESEHRKKMYKVYKRGWLLTRRAEKGLREHNKLAGTTSYSDKEEQLELQWSYYFGKLENVVSKEDITWKEHSFWNELETQHIIRARERRKKKKTVKTK